MKSNCLIHDVIRRVVIVLGTTLSHGVSMLLRSLLAEATDMIRCLPSHRLALPFIIILACAALASKADSSYGSATGFDLNRQRNENQQLRFERLRSCEACPGYQVVVTASGEAHFLGKSAVAHLGPRGTVLPKDVVARLFAQANKISFEEAGQSARYALGPSAHLAEIEVTFKDRRNLLRFDLRDSSPTLSSAIALATSFRMLFEEQRAFGMFKYPFEEEPTALVKLERFPVHSHPAYEVVIFSDGRVLYFGKRNVLIQEARTKNLSAERLAELWNSFRQIDFDSLPTQPPRSFAPEIPELAISLRASGKVRTVRFNASSAVRHYFFGDEIDRLTETAEWVCAPAGKHFPESLCDRLTVGQRNSRQGKEP